MQVQLLTVLQEVSVVLALFIIQTSSPCRTTNEVDAFAHGDAVIHTPNIQVELQKTQADAYEPLLIKPAGIPTGVYKQRQKQSPASIAGVEVIPKHLLLHDEPSPPL